MGFIVLVVILLILGAIGFAAGRISRTGNPNGAGGAIAGWSLGLALLGIVLATGFMSYAKVDNGHIGIVKQFGNLVGTLGSGPHLIAPWKSVATVSVRQEPRDYDMNTDNNSAVSKDSQDIYMNVRVLYQLIQAKSVTLYTQTGGDFVNRILDTAVVNDVKEITAKYQATDVAKNREQIRTEIQKRINTETLPQGIQIIKVSLKNVHFTGTLTDAINQTVEAQQQAKRASAQVAIKQAEALQLVASAKGQKEAAIQEAQGKAQSNLIEARATSQANALKSRNLTSLLVQQNAIDALNPNVTVIFCEQGQVCIPNGTNNAVPVPSK